MERVQDGKVRLNLEELESRIAPAGAVTVSVTFGGDLVIYGDALANDITILPNGDAPGEFLIESGPDATLVNGWDWVIAEGVTGGVAAYMGGGDDTIELNGVDLFYAYVDGGTGNNMTLVDNGTTIDAGVGVLNRAGSSVVAMEDVSIGWDVSIRNGIGDNTVYLSGDFAGSIRVVNPRGFATFTLENSGVAGSVMLTNRLGGGDAAFIGSDVAGNVALNDGNGDYVTSLSDVGIYGTMSIRNRTGEDTLTVDGSAIEGSLKVTNGNGDTHTFITDSTIGLSDFTTRVFDLQVRNGGGFDELLIDTVAVGRNTLVSHGNGGSVTLATNAVFGNALTALGRDGADDMVFEFLDVTGRTRVNTGQGDDSVYFDDANLFGPVNINTASGNDVIGLDSETDPLYAGALTFSKAVVVNAGSGDDSVVLSAPGVDWAAVYFYGPVTLHGGSGIDEVGYADGNVFAYGHTRELGFEETL